MITTKRLFNNGQCFQKDAFRFLILFYILIQKSEILKCHSIFYAVLTKYLSGNSCNLLCNLYGFGKVKDPGIIYGLILQYRHIQFVLSTIIPYCFPCRLFKYCRSFRQSAEIDLTETYVIHQVQIMYRPFSR